MNKILLLIIICFFVFGFFGFLNPVLNQNIKAQEPPKSLEIAYPQLPSQIQIPTTVQTPISHYIRYVYYFFIWITGFIALGVLFYGGFLYVSSTGNPSAIQEAKDQIFAGFLGILILLGSTYLLKAINPQLAEIKIDILTPPHFGPLESGIWLCKQETNEIMDIWQLNEEFISREEEFKSREKDLKNASTTQIQKDIISQMKNINKSGRSAKNKIHKQCYLANSSGDIKDDFNNKVKYVYSVPEEKNGELKNYGAFLFEDKSYSGNIRYVYGKNPRTSPNAIQVNTGGGGIPAIHPSSIISYQIIFDPEPEPEWQVTTFEEVNNNEGFPSGTKKEQVFPNQASPKCSYNNNNYCFVGNLNPSPKSIKIKGNYIVVLANGASQDDWGKESVVLTKSETNLLNADYYKKIIDDCGMKISGKCVPIPTSKAIFIISGDIL